ncbi:MAG: Bax inhibitor-1/YccA family protein [Bacteroidales bacterium]|nr:Bax inhibitor-1/YccA family protein [Bacteroidales bacterium]MBD5218147.1 Bax inhibitor-1/YccA family protein [Bacteroidales bacterium]MBD5222148.1 Bax inhibitor-1/YccA family protein [Bacteroidales bacterium]
MNYNNQTPPPYYGSQASVTRTNSIMKRVYVRMFIALLISAFVSLGVASSPAALQFIFGNKIVFWLLPLAMLGMAIYIPVRMSRLSSTTVLTLFLVYSAMMGAWIAPIFLVYRVGSIAYTFFITAGVFGAMSVYGYFTKSDLSRIGSFLIMALFGLIIAVIVNIFLASSTLEWIISLAGVAIFIGLTAWDTQQVKQLANDPYLSGATADKLATMGAFNLYLDFINLFLFLLRIFGGRD